MCDMVLLTNDLLISGKSVAKKEILEVIKKFNIQVNNLTQVSFGTYSLEITCIIFLNSLS